MNLHCTTDNTGDVPAATIWGQQDKTLHIIYWNRYIVLCGNFGPNELRNPHFLTPIYLLEEMISLHSKIHGQVCRSSKRIGLFMGVTYFIIMLFTEISVHSVMRSKVWKLVLNINIHM